MFKYKIALLLKKLQWLHRERVDRNRAIKNIPNLSCMHKAQEGVEKVVYLIS